MDQITQILSPVLDFFKGGPILTAIGAGLVFFIGSKVAKKIGSLVANSVSGSGVESKLGTTNLNLGGLLGNIVRIVIMIFVLMFALELLGATEVLAPIGNMMTQMFGFIPTFLMAGAVGFFGYKIAQMVSELVGQAGDMIRKISSKLNLGESVDLIGILKKVVFIVIFAPLAISAINILGIESISTPLNGLLNEVTTELLPNIFLGSIILLLFGFIGKFVSALVKDLLTSMNIANIASSFLGDTLSTVNLPGVLSKVVLVVITYIGAMEALPYFGLDNLVEILDSILAIVGKIAIGLVIIVIGSFVADLAKKALVKTDDDNQLVGSIIKTVVLALFLAMGLESMDVANEIVQIAFTAVIGAIAVAFALSFGLGGRDAAGEEMKTFFNKLNGKK